MASSSLREFQSVPVIDVAPLFDGSDAAARAVAAEIRRSAIEVGFFYVVQRSFKKLLDDLTADAAAAQRLSEIQREREEQRRIDERAADDRLRHNTVVAALRKAQRR